MARALSLGSLVAIAALAAACGGGGEPDLHSTFARIQREEARIEHAEGGARAAAQCPGGAERCAEECAEGVLACDEVCDAARTLCELAAGVDDRDARTRCDRATPRCGACRATLAPRCGGTS